MTNMGKSRLAKVIFTNIHKISDACANSFDRHIMIAQCMRNAFTFYKFQFPWKNGVSEKIKAYLPQHLPALQQLLSPHLSLKIVSKMICLISQFTFIFLTKNYYNMNFITSSSASSKDFTGTLRSIFADCFWRIFCSIQKMHIFEYVCKTCLKELGIWLKCKGAFEKFLAVCNSSKNTGLPQFVFQRFLTTVF